MESNHRVKFTIQQQIDRMKENGIKFTIEDEEFAKEYLSYNTYFFKLKAYSKLYDKDRYGKYIDLEFAYLRDLATIDSLLRKIILKIAIDIEHYLKVVMLRDFNESDEDGYAIVDELKSYDPEHYGLEIEKKLSGKACSNLVRKYKDNFAIWNFVEILSFSDFQNLYDLFYIRNRQPKNEYDNPYKRVPYHYFFNPVRMLRNAAAHNNCLISSLKVPYVSKGDFNYNKQISVFLGQNGISNKRITRQLDKPLIHDFCVMLYLYHKVAPKSAQIHMFRELNDFLSTRARKNREYYIGHATLCSAYEFIVQVVDVFEKRLQN